MYPHIPVLLTTVLDIIKPISGESVLDVTLGLGGHSEALLQQTSPSGILYGLDADDRNLSVAQERLKTFGDRARLIHANFRELPDCLNDTISFDIVIADLGLSSPHVDDSSRGFSHLNGTPLDMRFDPSARSKTAADILTYESEKELVRIFQDFGQLPRTHRFVQRIVLDRVKVPYRTSRDLKATVDAVYGYMAPKIMAQIYQALRIEVNDELKSLAHLLSLLPSLLRPAGRVGIITYHSLEDRLVKQALKSYCQSPLDLFTGQPLMPPLMTLLTKRPIKPSQQEIENNPRSRSAHLRCAIINK